jgi:hypothetical protein
VKRVPCFSTILVLGGLLAVLALVGPGVAADGTPTSTAAGSKAPATGFVAYYFHGNFRCTTCRAIEAYSAEAITGNFAEELASGRLTWRVVNVEEPENEHFVKDFELTTKSLVLVEYRDGTVVRFQNLPKVWQLVHDKESFLEYVRDSTVEFLGQG